MKEEYPKERYGKWAGNPKGHPYNPTRCAYEVFTNNRGYIHHQCVKKRGHGPDELFCKVHDPEAIKKRQEKQTVRYERKTELAIAPYRKLEKLQTLIRKMDEISEGDEDEVEILYQIRKLIGDGLKIIEGEPSQNGS